MPARLDSVLLRTLAPASAPPGAAPAQFLPPDSAPPGWGGTGPIGGTEPSAPLASGRGDWEFPQAGHWWEIHPQLGVEPG